MKKHKSPEQGLKPEADKKGQSSVFARLSQGAGGKAAVLGVFALFSLWILAIYNAPLLRQVEALSLFLPTRMFYNECMQWPGGLLEWAGNYLSQYFYHPWLGALICTAFMVALVLLISKAFRMPRWSFALALVPVAMLLLAFLQLGYIIFSMRSPSIIYPSLLGTGAAVAFVWFYRNIGNMLMRSVLIVAMVLIGYHYLGFYALFGAAMACVYEVGCFFYPQKDDKPVMYRVAQLVPALLGALSVMIVPRLYYRYVTSLLMPANLYRTGLPTYQITEDKMWIPFIIAFVLLGVFAFFAARYKGDEVVKGRSRYAISAACAACALVATGLLQCRDANFRFTLELGRAVADGEWEKAVGIADKNQGFKPTRLNVLYTDIALMRLGLAGDKMFAYRIGAAPYETTRHTTAMRDAGAQLISYHFGRVYNAYRWAMEYKVEYGNKPDYLKMMAKCALINKEPELARKYLTTLSQTKYHKDWAKKYLAYCDSRSLVEKDAEMSQILPLTYYRDHIGGDGGKLESYLMPVIAGLNGGTFELLNLSLECNLVQKNIDEFMARFGPTGNKFERVPIHFQEAVLLWSSVHNNEAWKQFKIDNSTVERFKAFQNAVKQYQGLPEEVVAEKIVDRFGDTYWYYFFLVLGMKTT